MPMSDQPFMTPPHGEPTPDHSSAGAGEDSRKRRRKSKSDGKPPTKRLANRNFVLALVFAVLSAGVVYFLISAPAPKSTYVAVAGADIPAGSLVSESMLDAVRVNDGPVQEGAITGTDPHQVLDDASDAIKGKPSQFPLSKNQQIVPEGFGQSVANLGTPLDADERLVSFRATVASSVAGALKPGDEVDLYTSVQTSNISGAGLLVPDLTVVSVTVSESRYADIANEQVSSKELTPSEALPSNPVPGIYVVRAKVDDVAKIVAADAVGKIYLSFRPDDAANGGWGAIDLETLLCETDNTPESLCVSTENEPHSATPGGTSETTTG